MIKKAGIILASLILLGIFSSFVYAIGEKMEISTTKDTYLAGDIVNLKVSLYDSQNNPIDSSVNILVEDAESKFAITKTIQANELVDINLGEGAPAGYWKISADYNGLTSTALFMVGLNELAKFEINDNVLTVTNIGNTKYEKTIQIVIGDTIGTKQLDLGVGENMSFRLIAPEGTYNLKVTDGKTTINQGGVALTGNVIGILDNRKVSKSPITTGVNGDPPAYGEETVSSGNSSVVYTFLFVVFGAAILLAIERNYRKSSLK